MDPRRKILAFLSTRDSASGKDLREHLGVSRQALNVHLRALIASGDVVKSGSTRAARYCLTARAPAPAVIMRDLPLAGLDEGNVYEEMALALNLRAQLRANVEAIARYAFTEMLNNAIDHSGGERCKIRFRLDGGAASFEVRDRGIGVFHSIASKFALDDEQTAMVELLKGKTTTMRERHTGEGIFFTSKAADRLLLRSHRIEVDWDSFRNDVFVSRRHYIDGTDVRFLVQLGTRRRLQDVFGEFAPADYDFRFRKTRVLVKLLQSDYVSRSEAKRLLANLEKFSEIVLDFRDVGSIGQGFADEVFRVFAQRHPEIAISFENANPVVAAMLRHVGGE